MAHLQSPFIIAIGASGAEGLQDINDLLARLASPLNGVVMVVLHRPVDRLSQLQRVLARNCRMPVVIAKATQPLSAGHCYIGEPDRHLTLRSGSCAQLLSATRHPLRNRTIDALFSSVAAHAGARSIGIVLSGSLDDGSRGLAEIHAAAGLTMVLDPHHKARGMQQNAIDYDGPISLVGSSRMIAAAVGHVIA